MALFGRGYKEFHVVALAGEEKLRSISGRPLVSCDVRHPASFDLVKNYHRALYVGIRSEAYLLSTEEDHQQYKLERQKVRIQIQIMAEGDSQAESSPAVIDEVDRPIVALKLKMANHQRMVGVAARVPRQRKSLEDKVSSVFSLFVSFVLRAVSCNHNDVLLLYVH